MPDTGWMTTGRALLVVLVIAVAWNLVGNLFLPSVLYVPANLAVAAAMVVVARAARLEWSELGLARADVGRGAVVGGLAMLVVGVVLAIGVAIPGLREFFTDDAVAARSVTERLYDGFVRIPLGTAVFEEVLFRSVILGILLVRTSTLRAVAISSLIFGVWHVVPALEGADGSLSGIVATTVGTVAITAVAGVLFAWLRLRSRSVVAPILAHTATNSFAYLAAVVVLDGLDG